MNKLKWAVLLVGLIGWPLMATNKAFAAGNATISEISNQEINDEGYGKDDVEYNNSEDEQMNVDEPLPGENTNLQRD